MTFSKSLSLSTSTSLSLPLPPLSLLTCFNVTLRVPVVFASLSCRAVLWVTVGPSVKSRLTSSPNSLSAPADSSWLSCQRRCPRHVQSAYRLTAQSVVSATAPCLRWRGHYGDGDDLGAWRCSSDDDGQTILRAFTCRVR